jgi:uncharacterized protein (DUF58 family)
VRKILTPKLDDLLELRHVAKAFGFAPQQRVNSLFSGLYASVFRGQGMDFEEVREYYPGDEIRNMHWRITARTGKPYLKVFREERERPVMLCIEHSSQMQFGTKGTFKSVQAARAAALLGWSATSNHERVGGILFGHPDLGMHVYRPVSGRKVLWRMLKQLTNEEIIPQSDSSDGELIKMLEKLNHGRERGSLTFIIGDFNRTLSEQFELRLGQLKQSHQVVIIPVDDDSDQHMPDVGKVIFVTPDGQRLLINTSNKQHASQYQQQWQQNRQRLQSICHRLGLLLIPLSTDEDIHLTLTRALSNHNKQGQTHGR